jgi:AraC-like DNA-binding protein
MEKALHLLKEGKWVKEVIPEIGYHNWGTFNIAFKKKYKHAPSFFKK